MTEVIGGLIVPIVAMLYLIMFSVQIISLFVRQGKFIESLNE